MNDAGGYDVLRLIEHSRNCYVSSDYVEGRPLVQWLKYHPNLSKEQLFTWIHEMAGQLECIHRCRGKPCYRYVNPYSMILTENKKLCFLDMSSKSNEQALVVMRRRSVREHFLPSEESDYQKESVSLDIYGLGRTIQYLLSMSEPDPPLTRREELRFQKIISRCLCGHSKKAYGQVSELRRQIPVYHATKTHFTKRKKALLVFTVFISVAAGIAFCQGEAEEPQRTEASKIEKQTNTGEETFALEKELGFLYFLDKKDYEKSQAYFSEVQGDEASEGLARLSEYMFQGCSAGEEKNLEALLESIEKSVPKEETENYYRCLIEGYRMLDSERASQAILRLSAECMDGVDEEVKQELTGYMAFAHEKTGETEKAIEKYTAMLDWEKDEDYREELYKKLVVLEKEGGRNDQAAAICRKGIEELTDSVELRLMHISMQCADAGVEREVCAQTIQRYIGEIPEIVEEQEFQKLTKEYGIVVEEENIWVGR